MRVFSLPACLALALASSALLACGGKSDDPVGATDAGAKGDSSTVNGPQDAGDFFGDAAQSSVDAATDAYVCVDIDLSTYDQTCQQTSDCISVNSGEVCTGSCGCGGAVINKSGEARYNAATKGLFTGDCPCAAELFACDKGKCTLCQFGPNPDGGCATGEN